MSKTLRIGPAADLLGVSVGTLRRWEAEGRITSDRSAAGQRLYRVDELHALAAGRPVAPRAPARPAPVAPAPGRRPAAAPPRPAPNADLDMILGGLDWGDEDEGDEDEAPPAPAPRVRRARPDEPAQRVRSARAAVEVERAQQELDELAAQREAARELRELSQRERERQERDAATAAAERARLDELRAAGRKHAADAGAPARALAAVTVDLSGYVTAARFPAYLGAADAGEQVRARVERVLRPWRDEQAREQRRGERAAAVARLTQAGLTWAAIGVLGWDAAARAEATDEVRAALAEEVRHDWTESQVRELVNEVLAEWE